MGLKNVPAPNRKKGRFESASQPAVDTAPESATAVSFPNQKKLPVLRWSALVLLTLVLLTAVISGIYVAQDPYNFRIIDNVSLGGLDVSGMTPFEAHAALKTSAKELLYSTDLSLELPQETRKLSPGDAGLSLKLWPAVLDAFRIGRTGTDEARQADIDTASHPIGLLPYLKYKEDYIRQLLTEYASEFDTLYTPSHWDVEGDMPELNLEKQNNPEAGQTLILTMGTSGTCLDIDDAVSRILAVYDQPFEANSRGEYLVKEFKVLIPEPVTAPDVQAIHESLYIAPVNDSLNMETYQPVSGSYGYGFDLNEVRRQVQNAGEGEVLQIPLALEEPEITGDEVYFRDVLGYCETPHTDNENRNHNLTLACQAMDGTILQPGDVFSYNETLGERTKERGYLRAGAYSGLKLVQSYGGGICQGSSTIYCAALYADLEIVHRVNHGFAVNYMDHGLDATVSWNGPDFQFRNNTHFPIKIAAEVSDGFVKVTLLGTEERDYYIVMESKASWTDDYIYAKSYKCKYDRETDELISREMEARSNYRR